MSCKSFSTTITNLERIKNTSPWSYKEKKEEIREKKKNYCRSGLVWPKIFQVSSVLTRIDFVWVDFTRTDSTPNIFGWAFKNYLFFLYLLLQSFFKTSMFSILITKSTIELHKFDPTCYYDNVKSFLSMNATYRWLSIVSSNGVAIKLTMSACKNQIYLYMTFRKEIALQLQVLN